MRVSNDQLEDLGVDARKAILWTLCAGLLVIVYAMAFPKTAGIIAIFAALFVMIMLHEAGHLFAAKRSGMKVTEYFVGFGPRLWSFKRGETEYGVKPFILGGYCRIVGMTNLEEIPPEDEERTYRAKSWHARVLVAGAGPAVHFAIALVLMFCVLNFSGDWHHEKVTTTLGSVSAGAQAQGMKPGDQILAINSTQVTKWDQVRPLIAGPANAPHPIGYPVRFVVLRGNKFIPFTVKLQQDPKTKAIVAGVAPHVYVPHPGALASIAQAREVAYAGGASIAGLGKIFSPSGIANYYHVLTGNADKKAAQERFVSPVGLGKLAGDAVEAGWADVFYLLIVINVFVGLFNLLPLLPFDGGHIAIATYEKIMSTIRRKRVQVDAAKLLPITVAVVAILGFILVSSVFLDITNPLKNPY